MVSPSKLPVPTSDPPPGDVPRIADLLRSLEPHVDAPRDTPEADGARRDSKEAARRRAQILRAAIAVFAERGFPKTRVSDIAKKAGVAYGLIYHYFDSKEAVLLSVFDDAWRVFVKALHQIADDGARSAPDKLANAADFLVEALRVEPTVVQVLIQEISRSERFTLPGKREAFDVIRAIVAEGQARGELQPDVDPQIAAYLYFGALETLASSFITKKFTLTTDAEAEALKRSVRRILLDGLRARPRAEP